eukprot:6775325-Pyramimonas_sp.AAC.2
MAVLVGYTREYITVDTNTIAPPARRRSCPRGRPNSWLSPYRAVFPPEIQFSPETVRAGGHRPEHHREWRGGGAG